MFQIPQLLNQAGFSSELSSIIRSGAWEDACSSARIVEYLAELHNEQQTIMNSGDLPPEGAFMEFEDLPTAVKQASQRYLHDNVSLLRFSCQYALIKFHSMDVAILTCGELLS